MKDPAQSLCEATLRSIVDGSPLGVCVVDADLRLVWANRVAMEIFRRVPDAIGRSFDEVMHGLRSAESAEEVIQRVRHTLRTGEPYGISELVHHCRDDEGTECYELQLQRISLSDARHGVVCHFRDVSAHVKARLELARAETRFRSIVEQSFCGVAETDCTGRLLAVNDRLCRMLGYSRRELLTRRFQDITHPGDLPRNLALFEALVAGGTSFELEKRYIHEDGSTVWVDNSVTAIRDVHGNLVSLIAVSIDITERKRAEAVLRESEEQLRRADRHKDEFLATLSHELRNPLAPIRHALIMLGGREDTSPRARHLLQTIERQVDHLVRMVDDLLEVSRISRGKIELRMEPTDVTTIVRSAIETSRPLIDASEHELIVSLPPQPLTVVADALRLSQVLANLLNNASKYTNPGGRIWLTVRREGADVVLSVRDDGVGIPARVLPRIFDMFVQVDPDHERAQGGLGIGLAVVKKLVEMHGGTVEARSTGPDEGSEIVVRLPAGASTPVAAEPEPEGKVVAERMPCRILVVDDNADAANMLGMLLEAMGNEVEVVLDGPGALRALTEARPDVVFLDLGMPGMSGYEVAQRIHEIPALAELTLVALTGWGQAEDRRRTQEAGFHHHLIKPVDRRALDELLATVSAKTRGRQRQRQRAT